MNEIVKYTIGEASRIDKEIKQLSVVYSAAKVKIGLTMAEKLREVEKNKLYLKLDDESYPTFARYIETLGISYKVARELIGVYETYILAGGYTIDQLSEISYRKLVEIKPYLFEKKDGIYELVKPKGELREMVSAAKSDLTISDIAQLRRDREAGENHKHTFETFTTIICSGCGLKEFKGKTK